MLDVHNRGPKKPKKKLPQQGPQGLPGPRNSGVGVKKPAPSRGPQGLPGPRSSAPPKPIIPPKKQNRTQRAVEQRDRPTPTDMHRGDAHKQSQSYIDTLQLARKMFLREHEAKHLKVYHPGADNGGEHADQDMLATTTRVGYQSLRPPPAEPERPKNPFFTHATQELLDPPPATAGWNDPKADRPRTDDELRHFLKTGEKPLRVFDIHKTLHASDRPIAGQLAAPALWQLKQSARLGHAVVGGIRGKNVIHELKHGHDTGSDLLKDVGVRGLPGTIGGLALDTVLFGGPLKFTARSSARKLEEKAARTSARGNWSKGFLYQVQAKRAATNRGIGIGVQGGIPFTSKRFEATIGEGVTSAAARKLHLPQGAGRLHDSAVGQAVGRAAVPHFRSKDVTPAFHEEHVAAQRLKRHKDAEAELHAQRRGDAFNGAIKDGKSNDEILAAAERQPVHPIIDTKRGSRVAQEHKDVTSLKRKERSLHLKEQRAIGRAEVQIPKQSRKLVGDIIEHLTGSRTLNSQDVLDKIDAHILAGGVKGQMAHAVKEFRTATSARIQAGHELSKARTAFKNATTGAPSLYTDAERLARLNDRAAAEAAAQAASQRLKTATDLIETTATRHAIRGPGGTKLGAYDRIPQAAAKRVEKIRHERAGVQSQLDTARAKAQGVAKHERYLVDAASGRPLQEVLDAAVRKEISGLAPDEQKVAVRLREEMETTGQALKNAGVLKPGDHTEDYVSHMEPLDRARKVLGGRGKGRASNPGLSKHREDPRDLQSQNLEHAKKVGKSGDKFERGIPEIVTRYLSSAHKAINDAEYLQTLKKLGKPVNAGTAHRLGEDEIIVHFQTDKGGPGFRPMLDHRGDVQAEQVQKILDDAKKAGVDSDLRVMPASVVRQETAVRAPKQLNQWQAGARSMGEWWDHVTGMWKAGVTVYNLPFYQVRNVADDSLRSWMADTDVTSFVTAGRLVASLAKEHGLEKTLAGGRIQGRVFVGKAHTADGYMDKHEFLRMAIRNGVGEGYYGGEVATLLGRERDEFALTSALRRGSAASEMGPRLATFLSAMRRGMSEKDAASWVRIHHFDYNELTDGEKVARRFIPFYTFASRNFQLQLRKMATRPGKYATIEAFREEMAKYAGLPPNWDEGLTEVDQRATPVPIPFGHGKVKIVLMPFSTNDIGRFPIPTPGHTSAVEIGQQQFDMFMQMIHPFPKAAAEMLGNHSYFFRGPIYPDKQNPNVKAFVPAPDFLADFRNIVPFPVKVNETGKDGKTIRAQWPAWVDYFVRQMPQSGFVATLATTSKNSRDQTASDRLIGQGLGVRIKELDDSEQKGLQARIFDRLSEIKLQVNNMPAKEKSKDGFFFTKKYQSLVDEQKALSEQLDRLTKRVQPPRLQRRPKTAAEMLQDQVDKLNQADPAGELQRKVARDRAKQAILGGG